ncbi:homocysteine-responsive endoplasmic reticulum-resident ubiquitin-like domain member 2 protein [Penaeus indicus]|uniref:homocysteine-responsive endoplasmic reticulum-resident ubiquitin-like domain member 2 protein n=1 Tax=Penaeus indicus TaxID=29960 RepID=UPI00300CA7AE
MSKEIVTLIIKAANQSVPDHHIDCNTEWSVLHLKDHLSSEHPSKPRVDEQRLIYSGQLLLDNILLRNILRYPSENNSYTIHLVCSPPRNTASTSPQQSQATEQRRPLPQSTPFARNSAQTRAETNTNQSMTGQQQEGPLANTESSDGVRRRIVATTSGGMPVPTQQTIDASAYPSPTQMVANAFQASGDPMQQMATMQQMYAHYMAYMQYMQMGGGMAGLAWPQQMVQLPSGPNPPASSTTTTTVPTVDQAEQLQRQQEQNAPADPQQQQQQQQQQQPQQIRMNAQGGEVDDDDDDEGMGRDWLDWIYVLSRMVVLLSIVYFYSTVSRFMIVVCIAMLLYLYQAGWFTPARRVEQPREADENENENDNIQDDRNNNINNNNNNNDVPAEARNQGEGILGEARNPGEEEAGAGDNQGNTQGNEGTDRVVEEIPVRPSILALSWTFLTSLFTSLIPEQPQVI